MKRQQVNDFQKVPFFHHAIEKFDRFFYCTHSHLFNSRGGWNKRVGGALIAKSINLEGGIFWKKLVFNCNKRVEGGKNLIYKSINVEGGCFFSKSVSLTLRLLER